jgi:hypothetical protein
MGIAANIKATGLNQPGMVFKSSIYPIKNAIIVVNNRDMIFESSISKYNIISAITIPISMIGPAGLGMKGFPGL